MPDPEVKKYDIEELPQHYEGVDKLPGVSATAYIESIAVQQKEDEESGYTGGHESQD